ncbi:MAG TPA: T9SS type A sorting domain-containing protein [Bacteroidia bacterium]|nr:T9SS type A sorting domain-containing protein [Bacteroidia bacterium]
MKKIYTLLVFIFISVSALAQTNIPYTVDLFGQQYSADKLKKANEEYQQYMLRRNPQWVQQMNQFEQATQQHIANQKINPDNRAVITIPIVFHMVWNLPQQFVTDAQVYSQLEVLNENFIRAAADTVNTPPPFAAIAANPDIQFCLAQRDPWGNPATGIERRQTTVTSFGFDDAVKFTSTGGMDSWDPMRYFNVWVCNTGGVCWGEFPTGTVSNTHGAVMHYAFFGSQFTQYGTFPNISGYFDRGEIMCHETGHCFNLRHIWGDDGTSCAGSDTCADTPNQQGPTSFCPTFPLYDSCTTSGAGIMFQNFMDYSDDDCYNLFTLGQNARMQAVLSTYPYNGLTVSNGCVPVPLFAYDAAITDIIIPEGIVCTASFSPLVTLRNWGQNGLTSCIITYQVDVNPAQTFFWTGNLGSLSSISVTLNPITVSTGMHTFTASTSQPNGFADGQTMNDQTNSLFTAFNGGAPVPLSQGFEATTFVPANWTLSNPDNGITWVRTTQASKTGVASAKIGNIYYSSIGQKDEMRIFPLDLTAMTNPVLSFEMAYTYYIFNNPPNPSLNFTDTLSVLISTDCGQTFSELFKKGGNQLSTVAPVPNTSSEFIPTANDWRLETIPLYAYQSVSDAIIIFQNKTGWGNALYIDDINIMSTIGIDELAADSFASVYPNPSNGIFTITSREEITSVEIYNEIGEQVCNSKAGCQKQEIDLSTQPKGIYFIKVKSEDKISTRKIVVE